MIKAIVWSAIGGAVVMIIFVFSVGWVVSSGSAQEKAEQMAEEAVIELSVPICVAQFQQDPNRTVLLEELKKISSWSQDEYVGKHGWATMPGQKDSSIEVARECAQRIIELK